MTALYSRVQKTNVKGKFSVAISVDIYQVVGYIYDFNNLYSSEQ